MARTLIISNRKGGTGKSSSAVNIAAELHARGQRVLLIDMDTQAHCAYGVGVTVARDAPTLHGFMAGRHPLEAAVLPTAWPGLDLIPGDPLFEHGSGQVGELLLRDALQQSGLAQAYDTIVLDTPPSLDALLLNALCAADRVLIPFVPHFLAGEGVRQLARVLFKIASRGSNENLRVLGFLPVMLDTRVNLHRQVTEGLGQQFGRGRMLPGIRNDIRVAEAFAAGQPLRYFAPKSRATTDYTEAVDALLERW
jgi:chromosome partitioning protein